MADVVTEAAFIRGLDTVVVDEKEDEIEVDLDYMPSTTKVVVVKKQTHEGKIKKEKKNYDASNGNSAASKLYGKKELSAATSNTMKKEKI